MTSRNLQGYNILLLALRYLQHFSIIPVTVRYYYDYNIILRGCNVVLLPSSFPQGKLTFTRHKNGAYSKYQDLLKGFNKPTIELGDLIIPRRHCLSPAGALNLQRFVSG